MPTHSSKIHESRQTYISYSIIYISIITQSYSTNMDHSENLKQPKMQHCLAQNLAQAEEPRSGETSRSGEPPPRLGESTKTSVRATRDLA